ncbi:MAG: DNA polymerase I, partial [Gemmatimonadota bacterium]
MEECRVESVRDYACEKADLVLRLRDGLERDLERYRLTELYRDVEAPLIRVLADMETAGIGIDTAFFGEVSGRLEKELDLIEQDIYKEAGEEFNINSTPQLREVLFETLDLP